MFYHFAIQVIYTAYSNFRLTGTPLQKYVQICLKLTQPRRFIKLYHRSECIITIYRPNQES